MAAARLDELRARLCSRMSFGTAGLRAPMGAGFSRINDLTIIQSTQVRPAHFLSPPLWHHTVKMTVLCVQGLYAYLSRCFADFAGRGVVVGFDTRGQEESGCTSQR